MGSIRITETSYVGEVSSIIEYEFSDASDFFAWSEYKQEALNKAVKSFVGGFGLDPEGSDINSESEPAKPFIDINVKKKDKLH